MSLNVKHKICILYNFKGTILRNPSNCRYLAICHSLKRWLQFGKRRTIACIISTWIFSLITACCWTFFTDVSSVNVKSKLSLLVYVSVDIIFL